MRVFISWSGEPSRSIAKALREWLPMVVPDAETWMSAEDIGTGTRWNDQVAAALERSDFGIICLTPVNLERPWVLFEAGALAKRFGVARVVPLLMDLKPADVTMPLASFQGVTLSEDGMLRLVTDMNAAREQPVPASRIEKLFKALWPDFNAQVDAARTASLFHEYLDVRRDPEDLIEELLEIARRIERRMDLASQAGGAIDFTQGQVRFAEHLLDATARLLVVLEDEEIKGRERN